MNRKYYASMSKHAHELHIYGSQRDDIPVSRSNGDTSPPCFLDSYLFYKSFTVSPFKVSAQISYKSHDSHILNVFFLMTLGGRETIRKITSRCTFLFVCVYYLHSKYLKVSVMRV